MRRPDRDPNDDVQEQGGSLERGGSLAVELLLDAGAVLASSLDLRTTMGQVAHLTVPRLAELCVIDLRDEDGSINELAVAAADGDVAERLEDLRRRHPLDPEGEHPVARVIRSGEPELLAEMTGEELRAFAQGSEHARFMVEHGYRTAIVAPLVARGRTLGALSVLRLRDGAPYVDGDLEVVLELARRAALAIDNARLFSDLRTVEQRLEAILANLAEAITVEDEQGRTVFANKAAAELLQASSPEEIVGAAPGTHGARFLICDEQGRELSLEQMPGRRLFAGEQPAPLLVRNIVRASGEERWLLVRSSPIRDPESGRPLYAVNVLENITSVKRVQLAEAFMAEASRTLASSMDYEETLGRIARLAVPQLADWCAVDVLSERGEIERVAVHHRDPRMIELAQTLDRSYHPRMDEEGGVAEVIRSGRPLLIGDLSPERLAAYARDAEHLRLLEALKARSVMVVPLAAPSRTLGAMTLATSESNRRLDEADLGVAVRLGRRSGTAVESARLYTERARIASTLQSALLPESLPEIPGVELRALYRAAGELNEVGGDFYDVFPYGGERWMLVIGDVCGKGARAAGVTALARHTLRAAAMLGQSPTGMLDTLHDALRRQPAGADLCTVCLIVLRPERDRARLTVTLAGHPLPVLIDERGRSRQIGRPGTLLGVLDAIDIDEAREEMGPGETLLLYTDGVPDALSASPQLVGHELAGPFARAPRLELAELLGDIEREVVQAAEGQLRDDIALLAVRLAAGAPPDRMSR